MDKRPSHLDPAIIVIFGISGDLSHRYLLPSLYHLIKDGLLNPSTKLVGLSRRELKKDEFFDDLTKRLSQSEDCDEAVLAHMKEITLMHRLDMESPASFDELLSLLNDIEAEQGVCLNRLYYLSIPPSAQSSVIRLLGSQGLNASCQHGRAETRLLIEKPFGYDLASAKELIKQTSQFFSEEQIYRIDHFLAKETVQNILTFRFKNPIFEAIWNNQCIAEIVISAKESIGIEGRTAFYEPLGALRDFIQSHLIQILGILLMDQPGGIDAASIHRGKQAALADIAAVDLTEPSNFVRGQYENYKTEVENPGSKTETYAEITVYSKASRWQGVPLRLLTGKAMDEKKYQATVTFERAEGREDNSLRFRLQPNEGIELDLITKKPGFDYETQTTVMDFSYESQFGETHHPNAYEKVLVDAVRGDHTLFATSQEILEAWRIVEPVLEQWSASEQDLLIYKPGAAHVK